MQRTTIVLFPGSNRDRDMIAAITKISGQQLPLFEQLGPRETSSTGIGLALVKRIAEVHGGRAWVESEGAGKGSTFCVALRSR